MERTPKPKTFAEIDLAALGHNYKIIAEKVKKASPSTRVIAVVKANAYGHGTPECVAELEKSGCDMFAVSCTSEALDVRKSSKADVIILGYTPVEDADILLAEHITQTMMSLEYARMLSAKIDEYKSVGAVDKSAKLDIHIKIDTGMNRIGFRSSDADKSATEIAEIAKMPNFRITGMFTHFATADEEDGHGELTKRQLEGFATMRERLKKDGVDVGICHVCNSAGTLSLGEYYMDAVRAGLILYGHSPDGKTDSGLKPVMKLKSTVTHVHEIKAGETVSYGATYKAEKATKLATIAIGYADGFIRAFSSCATVRLPDGYRAKLCGRVCMDQCMLDVTGHDVKIGDEVTVFGDDNGEALETLASEAGTISYELLCLVGKRVERKYV